MKIAVSATGPSIDDQVDPRFGRCPYYLIVETDDLGYEAIENPSIGLTGGAGIQSAEIMAEKGIKDLITGNCGPNAHKVLSAAGIGIMVGCSGVIREVIERYRTGGLSPSNQPNVSDHFGTFGDSAGAYRSGQGRGSGRGMGMGRGRGMGRGLGLRNPSGSPRPGARPEPPLTKEGELARLTRQADELKQQLDEVRQAIERLAENKKSD